MSKKSERKARVNQQLGMVLGVVAKKGTIGWDKLQKELPLAPPRLRELCNELKQRGQIEPVVTYKPFMQLGWRLIPPEGKRATPPASSGLKFSKDVKFATGTPGRGCIER